jgi:carboxylesterase
MQTPTLLIHAKEDDVSHPRNAERIQRLHGGQCEVVLLDNSYHMLHIDQERHKVADLTADFFEDIHG